MLNPGKSYNEVRDEFRWHIPEFYNIGVDVCDRWVGDPDRLALIYEDEKGQAQKFTFSHLKKLSNQLANGLRAHGVERGDRVAGVAVAEAEVVGEED